MIPKREPNVNTILTEMQMVFLDCCLLKLHNPKDMFAIMFGQNRGKSECKVMYDSLMRNSDAIAYVKNREKQIRGFFSCTEEPTQPKPTPNQEDIRKVMFDKISVDLVEAIQTGTLDYKQGAIVEKFMNKVLDYDDKQDEKPEPPRIYLPANCLNCRYRIAIEESDDTIDECEYCQYKKDCNNQGITYDYKTQIKWKSQEQ